jgi:hypothetical protein
MINAGGLEQLLSRDRSFTQRLVLLTLFVGALVTLGSAAAIAGDDVGVVDEHSGVWYLRDAATGETTSFYYGNPGDVPFVGDWDCNGVDTPGLYRQSDGYVYLRNVNSQGIADMSYYFGNPGDVPIPGDFNGDGCDTVSIYRPSQARFYIINSLGGSDKGLGAAEFHFTFGNSGDSPLIGDWNGDGVDGVGVFRTGTGLAYLTNILSAGASVETVSVPKDEVPVVGRWSSTDDVATYHSSSGSFKLPGSGPLQYGNSHTAPIAGDFGQLPGGDEAPAAPVATTLPRGVIWQPDIAASGYSEWYSVAISGQAEAIWNGGDVIELWNYNVDGSHNAGVRLGWQNRAGTDQPDGPYNIPKDAIYEFEFRIPVRFEGESNMFQFKTRSREHGQRVLLTKVSLQWRSDGSGYDAKLGTRIRSDGAWRSGAPDTVRDVDTDVVAGQWHTMTVRNVFGKDGKGRQVLWIDGVLLWDVTMSTEANNLDEYDHPKEWAINHYLGDWQGDITPPDSSIEIRNVKVRR